MAFEAYFIVRPADASMDTSPAVLRQFDTRVKAVAEAKARAAASPGKQFVVFKAVYRVHCPPAANVEEDATA